MARGLTPTEFETDEGHGRPATSCLSVLASERSEANAAMAVSAMAGGLTPNMSERATGAAAEALVGSGVVTRPLRPHVPGGIYHVTSRGNRRECIYLDVLDRRRFLGNLDDVVRRFAWRCHAYCLMGNHYHLVVQTPKPNISEGMQRLNSRYAESFNRRYRLSGHLFQGRFYSELVETDAHLLELARYVVLNPVRAGLCPDAADWMWSSYRATAGLERRPRLLTETGILAQFRSPALGSPFGLRAFRSRGA